MADEAKPTVATLATSLRQQEEDITAAKTLADQAGEAASTAVKITELHGKDIATLKTEQLALAKLVHGLGRAPGDAVKPDKLDNVLARLEALERNGRQDWSPLFEAHKQRVDLLAKDVSRLADGVTAIEDKIGTQPGGQFEDLAQDIEALKRADDATGKTFATLGNDLDQVMLKLASLTHGGAPDAQSVSKEIHAVVDDQIRRIVGNRAAFEQDLLERLGHLEHITAVMPLLPNRAPAPVGLQTDIRRALVGNVHAKLLELMREVDHIAKTKTAKGGGMNYKFRGIDDAQNAVGSAMRKIGLLMQTEVIDWQYTQMPVDGFDDKGREKTTVWSTSRVTMNYTFVSPDDGSTFSFSMIGEGRDAGDKSGSKAASTACKYALFQALMVPLEVDESDDDNPVMERQRDFSGQSQQSQSHGGTESKVESGPHYNPAMDSSSMAGADVEETLMQKAAQAAHYLRQAQGQPAEVALKAIKGTKERIAVLEIGSFKVDGVLLDDLVNTALQNVNQALAVRTGGTGQGVTRQGQQQGDGARAAAGPAEPSPGYAGSAKEYEDALQVVGTDAPTAAMDQALKVIDQWDSSHAADFPNPGGTAAGDHDY